MTSLSDRVTDALNEVRILILGAEILLGFQFDAVFLSHFNDLTDVSRRLDGVAYALMLVAVILLVSPGSFHRIVERGNDTARLLRVTTGLAATALGPFAACLGIDEFLVAGQVVNPSIAAIAGCALAAIAFIGWYGIELVRKKNRRSHRRETEQVMATPLTEKIKTIGTEIRVILPGAQALLGFQFSVFLTDAFGKLSELAKLVHFACLTCMAIAVVLLMAPAAYHRIATSGEATKDVEVFGAYAMLGAMTFLGLSMTGDFYVILRFVTGSDAVGATSALIALGAAFGLWFGYPLTLRRGERAHRRAIG